MTESDKIKHILKGVEEVAFQILRSKNPQTISDVVKWCQSYDDLRKQHIFTRQRPSLEVPQRGSLSALATSADLSALLPHIEQFVREVVSRQLSLLCCAPQPSSTLPQVVQCVIPEPVPEAIPSVRQPPVALALIFSPVGAPVTRPVASPIESYLEAPLTYASVVTRQPLAPCLSFVCPSEQPAGPYPRVAPRTPNPWRTPDNR